MVLWAMPAAAQKAPADAAVAEAMFQAGRQRMAERNYAEACEKFEASFKLEPAGGTLLNLAVCHEKQGRIATAYLEFQQAYADAIRDKREDREQLAQSHMAALRPRLPRLVVQAEAPVPGMTITLGHSAIPPSSLDLQLPFDPGQHELRVQAPGFRPWIRTIVVKEGARLEILVPALQPVPRSDKPVSQRVPPARPQPRSKPTPVDEPSSSVQVMRSSAWIGGATGVALIGVGSYFGVQALRKKAEADGDCGPDQCNSELGSSLDREAHDAAVKANVLIGGGVVLTGLAALTLLWTAEDNPDPGASAMSGAVVGGAPNGGFVASFRGYW